MEKLRLCSSASLRFNELRLADRPSEIHKHMVKDHFICVLTSSRNKIRAMMLLDWANQEENCNLMIYGVKSKGWEPVPDKNDGSPAKNK